MQRNKQHTAIVSRICILLRFTGAHGQSTTVNNPGAGSLPIMPGALMHQSGLFGMQSKKGVWFCNSVAYSTSCLFYFCQIFIFDSSHLSHVKYFSFYECHN